MEEIVRGGPCVDSHLKQQLRQERKRELLAIRRRAIQNGLRLLDIEEILELKHKRRAD